MGGSTLSAVLLLIPMALLGGFGVRFFRRGLTDSGARLHEGGIEFRDRKKGNVTLLWDQVRSLTYERLRHVAEDGAQRASDHQEWNLTVVRNDGAAFYVSEPGAGTIYEFRVRRDRRAPARRGPARTGRRTNPGLRSGEARENGHCAVAARRPTPLSAVRKVAVADGELIVGEAGRCEAGKVANVEVLLRLLREDFGLG
jgi:hypothetical protein